MKTAYIGIGSNIGDKYLNGLEAVKRIDQIPGCKVTRCSDWYSTKPVGVEGQDWYINGVVSVSVDISARKLLKELQALEKNMGRVRRERWGPRTIDLDVLLYGREVINDDSLEVPHPRLHLRKFVLVPLAQIAPDLQHPVLKRSMSDLLAELKEDEQIVVPLNDP